MKEGKNMKKILALMLCLIMVLTLCACRGNEAQEAPAEETPNWEENFGDEDGFPDFVIPETSSDRNEELIAAFTPEGAEVIADTPGELILHSSMSVEALAAFYTEAIEELGSEETAEDFDSIYGDWVYTGRYGEGKTIVVCLRDDGDYSSILINY